MGYYQHDHLGTPIQAVDKAGQVIWAADYHAFGQATLRKPPPTPRRSPAICGYRGNTGMGKAGCITTGTSITIRMWGGISPGIRLGWVGVKKLRLFAWKSTNNSQVYFLE
ncbi:RHS domain-containing protein [Chitiniphilus shinanonensis]|uniref:RHS domain-containing protein n=1 Tax=Chitiniphilus shinanonensis TaxID=553088 RepID=UPI003DA733B0